MGEDELQQRVVARIRALAEEKQIPLSRLPEWAGVSRSHFWSVMAGEKSPTLGWLSKIAAALEVDPFLLLQPSKECPKR